MQVWEHQPAFLWAGSKRQHKAKTIQERDGPRTKPTTYIDYVQLIFYSLHRDDDLLYTCDLKAETYLPQEDTSVDTSVSWHTNAEAAKCKLRHRDLVPVTSLLEMEDFDFLGVAHLQLQLTSRC